MSERREVINTEMKRSAITWLSRTLTFIFPHGGRCERGTEWSMEEMQLSGPRDLFCLLHERKEWRSSTWNIPLWIFTKERKSRSLSTHLYSAMMAWIMLSALLSPSSANCFTKFIAKTAEGFCFSLSLNNGIMRNWSICSWAYTATVSENPIFPFSVLVYCKRLIVPKTDKIIVIIRVSDEITLGLREAKIAKSKSGVE